MYGEQEQSSYNGYFESTCFHPLLLFNREGDFLAAKLRPGNVHSAEGWEELLLPEIERQQRMGKEVASPRAIEKMIDTMHGHWHDWRESIPSYWGRYGIAVCKHKSI